MIEYKRGIALALVTAVVLSAGLWLWIESDLEISPRKHPIDEVTSIAPIDDAEVEGETRESSPAEPTSGRTMPQPIDVAKASTGFVGSRITGDPVSGASVSWEPGFGIEPVKTAADGTFAIDRAPVSLERHLVVRAKGHASLALHLAAGDPGPKAETLEVWLDRAHAMQGRVLNDAGEPVDHARVTFSESPGTFVWSDGRGYFTANGLGWAPVTVWAHHPDFGLGARHDVPAGSEGVEIELQGPVIRRAGTVTSAEDGQPIAGALVSVLDDRLFGVDVTTDGQGHFVLDGLPPEPLRLRASAPGFSTILVPLHSGSSAEELELRLTRPEPLQGFLVEQTTGSPLGGVRIGISEPGGAAWEGESHEDGRFETDVAFSPGALRVTVLQPGWMLARGRLSEAAATIDHRFGQPARLVLARGDSVSGRVLGPSGEPAPGCRLTLVRGGSALMPHQVSEGWSDVDGGYSIGPASAMASLKVVAFHGRYGSISSGPFDPNALPAEGLILQFGPSARLSGRVVDRRGEPVTAATIFLSSEDASLSSLTDEYQATTDREGRFEVGPVPSGPYRVSIETATAPAQEVEASLEVGEEDRTGLEWTYDRGARLEIRVIDEFGESVARARVSVRSGSSGSVFGETDLRGRLVLEGLADGVCSVTVLGGADWDAVTVERRTGSEATDIVVSRRARGGVRVRLLEPNGMAIDGPVWVLQRRITDGIPRDPTWRSLEASDGLVLLALEVGEWELGFSVEGFPPLDVASTFVAGGETVDLGTRKLLVGPELTGQVVDALGRGVAAARVEARPLSEESLDGPWTRLAFTGQDGRFTLRGIGDLPVEVRVEAEGFCPKRQVRGVTEGGPMGITIDRGGTILVKVRDPGGRPIPGQVVMLAPHDPEARSASSATRLERTDADGRARFDHVPSGLYRLRGDRLLRGPTLVTSHEGGETISELERVPGR
ncbi:MAG: carboxypeptidase-like regulatory domain-containing protein [Planctomycetota bacterium]